MRRILVVVIALAVLVLLGVLLWPRVDVAGDQAGPAVATPGQDPTSTKGGAAHWVGTPVATEQPDQALPTAQRMDAETRARLLAEIGRRLAAAAIVRGVDGAVPQGPGGGGVTASEAAPGSLSKEYIQAQVREIVPLVKECYEQALETQPGLSTTLKVRFTIEGDPELGGVISSSDILDIDGGVAPGSLGECVRETMYALRLKAPEGGGKVTVHYPFRFQSRPEPGDPTPR
ncbi:MAG: AgmX/PglI C-terminal domain-containing protein [Pseudomonadota bacterium]